MPFSSKLGIDDSVSNFVVYWPGFGRELAFAVLTRTEDVKRVDGRTIVCSTNGS